jgi:hypothetical protein
VELSMQGFGYHDVSRSAGRTSAVGIAVALSAAMGVAALLMIVSGAPSGVPAFARTQPEITVPVNRRLKGDRLELSPSNLPADEVTPQTILPKIAPTPLESTPEPRIEITREARLATATSRS